MKFILTIVASLLIVNSLNGQGQWEIVNQGFVCTINSVDFINIDTGWIAGKEGIFQSTDGSKKWQKLNDDHHFFLIDFHDETIGWATVYGNSLMKTSDGGRTWVLQESRNDSIKELHAVAESIVYAVGDSVLKTEDGGSRWQNIGPTDGIDFSSACFVNADTGIVIGNGRIIFQTFDGGKSWEKIEIPDLSEIYNVQFTHDSSAYFFARKPNSSNQYIYKTTDYFNSWTVLSETDMPIHSCHFFNNDILVAIAVEDELGEGGTWDDLSHIRLVKSYDGGLTWVYPDSFIPLTYSRDWEGSTKMHFIGNSGYYLGGLGGPTNFILKSVDQGNAWSCSNISRYPFDVQFIDRNKGYVLAGARGWHFGAGRLFKTEDGGGTWDLIYNYDHDWLSSVLFVNDSLGFLTSYGVSPQALFTTSDGGYSWDTDTTIYGVADLCLANDSTAWAYTQGGIYNTIKGGDTWNLFHANKTLSYPSSICFLDEKRGWVVGPISTGTYNYKNRILKYKEEEGWSEIPIEINQPITKMRFIDNDFGWISGGYNNYDGFKSIFLRSNDGGETWSQNSAMNYVINDFYFENKDHGWAVGWNKKSNGTILETFNGGRDWDVITDTLPSKLHSLHFADGYGWAVGDNGLILKYDSSATGIKEVNKRNRGDEPLFQNYPNPFRSKTMISYHLSAPVDVKMRIYDLSGRIVTTLVNKLQTTGRYEVEWNAEGMEPGIYLCTFHAEDQFKAIKMILIK